ncbi:MAG: ribonuclease [Bacteroidetes bacterium]|nr:ribonuclease [Bacteroidota bacterium]
MTAIKKHISNFWEISKKTVVAWNKADPFRQGAIISYYAIFSIPALLVIIISAAGYFFGKEAVSGEISNQVTAAMGADTAKQIEEMVANSSENKNSVLAAIIGVITLLVGATGVFVQLQKSLDLIWEVEVKAKKAWLKSLKDRLFSFGLILSIGFLLLISLLISAGLAAFSGWIKASLPDFMMAVFFVISFAVNFAVLTVLFALMFRILPDARVRWKDVWLGAMITALLFIAGKFALGLYFGKANPGSAYGAAGSIILLMLWVNYSSMILFLGAEYTKQFALHFGHEIEPAKDAVRIEGSEKEREVKNKQKATNRVIGKRNWSGA